MSPAAFWFAATLPVVVAFYLLKRKRVVRLVASAMLWQKFLAETEANAPFQKLRHNWLLILQLLLLALALLKSTAALKHLIVFSDGDPAAPQKPLVDDIVARKITISTVMIGGHVAPDTMSWLASEGHGRFWAVGAASDLPRIFIKEASVILKSAIFEEPFKPQMRAESELTKGIGPSEFPTLLGYVCTTPKSRAEVPLVTQKGDPLLAQWQYGLGDGQSIFARPPKNLPAARSAGLAVEVCHPAFSARCGRAANPTGPHAMAASPENPWPLAVLLETRASKD